MVRVTSLPVVLALAASIVVSYGWRFLKQLLCVQDLFLRTKEVKPFKNYLCTVVLAASHRVIVLQFSCICFIISAAQTPLCWALRGLTDWDINCGLCMLQCFKKDAYPSSSNYNMILNCFAIIEAIHILCTCIFVCMHV